MHTLDPFTAVGTMLYTGEVSPVSGEYRFVCHADTTRCFNQHAKFTIYRKAGQRLPSHYRCNKDAIWKLEKIPEAK